MDYLVIALFWLLLIVAFARGGKPLLYMFFGSVPFGAIAVIPTAFTGGLTLTPTPIVALAIAAKCLVNNRGGAFFFNSALHPRKLALIFFFYLFAVLVTYFSPRFFAHEISVIPVRGLLNDAADLVPTTQNLSQIVYLGISIISIFSFGRLLQNEALLRISFKALCFGAGMTVLTGFADFASQYAPLDFILDPFRTATYALLTDVEVFGGKRVVGLMPEASSYGTVCIAFLSSIYFLRFCMPPKFISGKIYIGIFSLLLLLIWLSKSSSAYVVLIFVIAAAAAEWFWRFSPLERNARRKFGLKFQVLVTGTIVFLLAALIVFVPSVFDPVTALFDRMVLQKTDSESFTQRNEWTSISWNAMISTYGLGVGTGSTRSSNGVVAIFSSTGFLGALLFYGFVAQSFLRRPHRGDDYGRAVLSGVRWSLPPIFMMNALIGTSADFGLMIAWLLGLAYAASARRALAPGPVSAHAPAGPSFSPSPALRSR